MDHVRQNMNPSVEFAIIDYIIRLRSVFLLFILLREVTVSRQCLSLMLQSGTPSNVISAGDISAKHIKVFLRERNLCWQKYPIKEQAKLWMLSMGYIAFGTLIYSHSLSCCPLRPINDYDARGYIYIYLPNLYRIFQRPKSLLTKNPIKEPRKLNCKCFPWDISLLQC